MIKGSAKTLDGSRALREREAEADHARGINQEGVQVARIPDDTLRMNVSRTSPSAASPSNAGEIDKLQKQLKELTKELRAVDSSGLTPKARIERAKLLQAMIQMVQQQISALLQSQRQTESLSPGHQGTHSIQQKAPTQSTSSVNGGLIDVFA